MAQPDPGPGELMHHLTILSNLPSLWYRQVISITRLVLSILCMETGGYVLANASYIRNILL